MTKVLVIESDFKQQLAMKCYLACKGLKATVCSTTREARKLLFRSDFKLILIDIHMLDENAFTFVKFIRKRGLFTPTLFIGERSYQELLDRECADPDEYILKPFVLRDIGAPLGRLLLHSSQTGQKLEITAP